MVPLRLSVSDLLVMVPVRGTYTWSEEAVPERVVQLALNMSYTPWSRQRSSVRLRNCPASHTIVVRFRVRAW